MAELPKIDSDGLRAAKRAGDARVSSVTQVNLNDRRDINWRLGWIDRRRKELQDGLAMLDKQEREILGLAETN